jgi:hypothetical protein
LTTYLHQAKNWANVRCRLLQRALRSKRPRASSSPPKFYVATVLRFEVSREEIALPEALVFVTEGSNPDYWDLVLHCRQGGNGRHRLRGGLYYDIVYGPVSLWPQTLVIKDCDQISFHNRRSVDILDQARPQRPYTQGSPLF